MEEFKQKNPINIYKDTLLTYCIKHPIQAEFSEYLDKKKAELDSLVKLQPTNILKEYSVVIETLM